MVVMPMIYFALEMMSLNQWWTRIRVIWNKRKWWRTHYICRYSHWILPWLYLHSPTLDQTYCTKISHLAQGTQMRYDEHLNKIVRRINKAIRYGHEKPGRITFPILEARSLRVVGYSDAGYSSSYDLSSQLGRIVLLIDDTGAAAPIIFKSYKSRRIARSILSRKQMRSQICMMTHTHLDLSAACTITSSPNAAFDWL